MSTNLTRHDLQLPGSEMRASMMLSETTGEGHIMFSTSAGPAFTISTQRLDEIFALLDEALTIYRDMKPLPADLTAEDIADGGR